MASVLWFLYCVNQASTSTILIKSNSIMVSSDSERGLRMYFYIVPNTGPVVVSWTRAWESSERKTYHHWNVLQSSTQSYLPLGGNGMIPFSLRFAATKLLSIVLVHNLMVTPACSTGSLCFCPVVTKGPALKMTLHYSHPEVLRNCWTWATSCSFCSRPANYELGLVHSSLSFWEAGAI